MFKTVWVDAAYTLPSRESLEGPAAQGGTGESAIPSK